MTRGRWTTLAASITAVVLSLAGMAYGVAASSPTSSPVVVAQSPIEIPVQIGSSLSTYTVQPDPVTVAPATETVTVTETATPSPTVSDTPTPTPSSSTTQPPPSALWSTGYDNGLGSFDSTSWNNQPAAPAVTTASGHGNVGAYTVPAGGSRCETVPTLASFTEGSDFWFGWSTELAPGFPAGANTWQVLTQWKNDGTGSPPIELKVQGGQFLLDGGYGWPGNTSSPKPRYFSMALGAAAAGTWDRWVFHVRFSSTASVGTVDVWRNGSQVATAVHPPGGTLYPNLTSYLKNGYYRDSTISTPGTVYQDDWAVGTTQASVN